MKLSKLVQQFYDFYDEHISQRVEQHNKIKQSGEEEERKGMMYYMLIVEDDDGSDTVATSVVGFFFYVVRYPRVYTRLTEEIRTAFTSADEIHMGPTMASCKYLQPCIDETMRMCPINTGDLSGEVLTGGLEVDSNYIPESRPVGVANWALAHNQEIYKDQWVYRPERWIVDSATDVTAGYVAQAQGANNPFSFGVDGCVGQKVGMQEWLLTVAETFYRMDLNLLPPSNVGGGSPELVWGMKDKDNILLRYFRFWQDWRTYGSVSQMDGLGIYYSQLEILVYVFLPLFWISLSYEHTHG